MRKELLRKKSTGSLEFLVPRWEMWFNDMRARAH